MSLNKMLARIYESLETIGRLNEKAFAMTLGLMGFGLTSTNNIYSWQLKDDTLLLIRLFSLGFNTNDLINGQPYGQGWCRHHCQHH